MNLEEFRKYQQEQYAKQREANLEKINAIFQSNSRNLNNSHLLKKEEN